MVMKLTEVMIYQALFSSGEHLNDLCLTPTDIFDIEQPGAGIQRVRFYPTFARLCYSISFLFYLNVHFVHAVLL